MSDSIRIGKIKEDKTHVWVTFDKISEQSVAKLKAACIASDRGFDIEDTGNIKFKHLTTETYAESQARLFLFKTLGPEERFVEAIKSEIHQTGAQINMDVPKLYDLVLITSQIGAVIGCLVGLAAVFSSFAVFSYSLTAGFTALLGGVFTILGSLVALGGIYCFLAIVTAQIETRNAIVEYTSKRS